MRQLNILLSVLLGVLIAASMAQPAYASWFNSTTYGYGYGINSNTTAPVPISVNDTYGVGNGDMIWTMNNATSERKWVVCSVSGCKSGLVDVENSSAGAYWHNTTVLGARGGMNSTLVYPADVVVWLHMDEAVGQLSYDSSAYNRSATGTNTPTYNAAGKFGKSIEYEDANSEYSLVAVPCYTSGTVMGWWKQEAQATNQGILGMANAWSFGNICAWMDTINATSAFEFYIGGAGGAACAVSPVNYELQAGQWYHIVGVWNTTECNVFVNGAKVGSDLTGGASITSSVNLVLGDRGASHMYWDGMVDEFSYWNRTLTDAEIKMYYDMGVNSVAPLGAEETTLAVSPYYWNNATSPASPREYGLSAIEFNISWNVTGDTINSTWVVHNLTGTSAKYYMVNTSATGYGYTYAGVPAAGVYDFTFYANASSSGANNTPTYKFTVNKQTIAAYLAVNGTQANFTGAYPNMTNASAWTNTTGVSPTLYRNGTAAGTGDIQTLAYGIWNYTASLSHQNYTAADVTRWVNITQGASGITISASPGWTAAENTQITITCAGNIARSLRRNGVLVANPYTASLPVGTYIFNCSATDAYNYTPSEAANTLTIQLGGYGCTNSETYAFRKDINVTDNWMTFNLTELVADGLVRSDLGDVYANNSVMLYTNTTGGYYITANATGITNFSLFFGNYFIAYNYSGRNLSATMDQLTAYSEINPYYTLTFYEETTGIQQLPPNSNTTVSMFCANGTSSFTANISKLTVAAIATLDEIRTLVSYSASSQYSRWLQVDAAVEALSFYLVDAYLNNVLQVTVSIDDETGTYGAGSVMMARRYMGDVLRSMTENVVDAEEKTLMYLRSGERYLLYIYNGNATPTYLGELYADPTDLTKKITISSTTAFNLTSQFNDINMSILPESNIISINTTAASKLVTFSFYVYNVNGTLTYYGLRLLANGTTLINETNITTAYGGRISVTYDVINLSNVTMVYYFKRGGYDLYSRTVVFYIDKGHYAGLDQAVDLVKGALSADQLQVLVIILLIIVGAALSVFNAEVAALGEIMMGGMLTYFGLLAWGTFFVITLAFLAVALIRRRWL